MMTDGHDRQATSGVYWFAGDERWRLGDITPLITTVRADVCVVGGGFTGLWAALAVKREAPGADVVLLEREFCGSGASGRNGGWVEGLELMLPNFIERFGVEGARRVLEASLKSLEDMQRAVRDGDVDCDLDLQGGLIVATCEAHAAWWTDLLAAAVKIGREDLFTVISREEAAACSGAPKAYAGLRIRHAGSVQPALLAQGLRRLTREAGVHIFEASPMTKLRRSAPAVVETSAGRVVADRVVLAAGPWLAAIPELRRTLFIIPSHVVATAPAPELLDKLGWARGVPFSDARATVHYGQRTADGRLVFGRGGGRLGFAGRVIPEHFHDEGEVREIVEDMRALLPDTHGAGVLWQWGGPVDRAQHGYPWVGTIGKHRNVHYGVGYSGNGVGPSHLIGRILASVALGAGDEYASSPLASEPPSYLPMEPLRSMGARTVRAAVKRCEDREEQGLDPDWLSRQLRKGLGVSVPKGVRLHWEERDSGSGRGASVRHSGGRDDRGVQ